MTRLLSLLPALLLPALLTGCSDLPCECNPTWVPIPDDGAWGITDIRVTDHRDGGSGRTWAWTEASPWGDVTVGEVRMEGGQLFVAYTTEDGTFLVEFEQSDGEGF